MRSILSSSALVAALALAACAAPAPRAPSAQPNVRVLAPPLRIPALERERTLRVYLPPSYAQSTRHYPVIYMHDGQNLFDDATSYAGEWGVDETLNDLARAGFEAIVVGVDNGGDKRMNELNPWPHPQLGAGEGEAYVDFIVRVVKPMIDAAYRTQPGREHTAIFGSSMGGLISHYAIQRHPQVFGKAGVFSPAYWPAPAIFEQAAGSPPPADARLYFYMGGREGGSMVGDVQRMHAQMQALPRPPQLTLRIVPEAEHNEAAWRAEFARAVRWLYELP